MGGETTSTYVGEPVSEAKRTLFIVAGSLEVISGGVGNCLLLVVILTSRELLGMRSFHYLFLANMAVADFVVLGYCMTFIVLGLILGHYPIISSEHCTINAFLAYSCTLVSLASLVSISLNRYLHVCHLILYSRVSSRPRIVLWCLLLWVGGASFALPPLLGLGQYGYERMSHACAGPRTPDNVYISAVCAFFLVSAIVAVCCFNAAIFRKWREYKMVSHCGRPPADQKEEEDTFAPSSLSGPLELTTATDLSAGKSAESREPGEPGQSAEPGEPGQLAEPGEAHADDTQQPGSRSPGVAYASRSDRKQHLQLRLMLFKESVRRFARLQEEREREQAFVNSLLVVFLLAIVCFLPHAVYNLVLAVNPDYPITPDTFILSYLVLLFNNSVNWLVYGAMNRHFRAAYVRLVKRVFLACCAVLQSTRGADAKRKRKRSSSEDESSEDVTLRRTEATAYHA